MLPAHSAQRVAAIHSSAVTCRLCRVGVRSGESPVASPIMATTASAVPRSPNRHARAPVQISHLSPRTVVDRFGRVWEGRAGGVARRVRGAHTLGFNATSAGVAVIGNFEISQAVAPITDAVASVAAWKLSRAGIRSARYA